MSEAPRKTLKIDPSKLNPENQRRSTQDPKTDQSRSPNPNSDPSQPQNQTSDQSPNANPSANSDDPAAASSQFSNDSGDKTDAMRDAFASSAGGERQAQGTGPLGRISIDADRLTQGEWAAFFCFPFSVARMSIATGAGVDLETLNVTPQTPGASDAAQAAYNLCLAVPFLEPLTRRDNSALTNGILVAAFVANVGQGAYAEYRKKRPALDADAAGPHPDDVTGDREAA